MSVLSLCRFALVVGLFTLLAGCASKPAIRFVWPPPPDQARLEWKGVYYSEQSFKLGATAKAISKFTGSTDEAIMTTPFGIVSDGKGRVYVADIHQHNIRVFDFNARTADLLLRRSPLDSPAGLALDQAGNLYVADSGRGLVAVYAPDGVPLLSFGAEELTRPAYLAIDDQAGRIYVSDGKENFIAVYDLQGEFLFKFGEAGNGEGQLFGPQGLALSPAGELYVADMLNARIQYFDKQGKFLGLFGTRGDQPGEFDNPKDLAFNSEGNLFVIDGRRSDLMIFTPAGELLLVIGEGKASVHPLAFGAPRGLSIDVNDQIFVSESLNRRFSSWQYLSDRYLAEHPFTAEDKQRLLDAMRKPGLDPAR